MNGLHDQQHKRTSITELLNPVATTPSGSLDPSYNANHLGAIAVPQYGPGAHQGHGGPPAPYHPSMGQPGNSFSLRAANWDHGQGENPLSARRGEDEAGCRYGSGNNSHPHQPPSHSHHPAVCSDQYHQQRPRMLEAPANYGADIQSWSHTSHDPPQAIPYPIQVAAPIYPDERTAEAAHKNYAPGPYEHRPDMPPQLAQNGGYYPLVIGHYNPYQNAERVSVRLAARHTLSQSVPQPHMPPGMFLSNYPGVAFLPVVMSSAPMQQPKRTHSPEEEPEEPKSKKSKSRAKNGDANGTSRRGYNSKKRNEAAQIAAQNAQMTFSPTTLANGKGKEKAGDGPGSTPATPTESSVPGPENQMQLQLHPELQFARCMSNRYRSEEFPRCVSCTRRWAGDTCRFQGIRFFLKNGDKNIVGISFVETQKADGPSMNFPGKWNTRLESTHIDRIKSTVAKALLPVLKQEAEHIKIRDVIRRTRESEVRATCDTCMTSIFSSSWMCRLCGREACHECFEQVKELTTDRPGATEAEQAALQARRDKHAHINPFFLSCTRRNEHRAADFSAMTRFSKDELKQAIVDMEALLADEATVFAEGVVSEPTSGTTVYSLPESEPCADDSVSETTNGHAQSISHPVQSSPAAAEAEPHVSAQLSHAKADSAISPEPSSFSATIPGSLAQSSALPSIPVHTPLYFTDTELTDEVFKQVWKKGDPLVVTNLLHHFHVQWTPEYFKAKYGSQNCLILECQNDQNKRVTVGEFFSLFGQYEGRRDCWKLKDWPPSTDFKSAFPELYEDFAQATPVPNYVRRDGVLNVASHFPSNAIGPDLGPKMYNAMASFESHGSKGSTRLHMDMADAINIMLHAAQTPDGRPGTAAWDLFKAEDALKLRKFLRKKFKGQYQHDPIHSQQFYLDTSLRQELFDDFGVKSYRIYQKPGEAVFIPAGCAHQVCNLADCIKVACDFVSPENIDRCELLTREFREQNQSMAWKEDVLQLRTMMWFAWLSCTRQEKEMLS